MVIFQNRGECAFIVDVDDSRRLSERIEKLISDSDIHMTIARVHKKL